MKLHILLILLVFSFSVFGQKDVASLNPKHAIALEQFLSKNKEYGFLSEKVIDADYLRQMREWFGKTLKPYYVVADFNRDRITDFALILAKEGEIEDQGEGFAETHRFNHNLAIVIFNGTKTGGFRQAFIQDVKVPLACFISLTEEKKKRLAFGVTESDADTMIFTPVGKGYIIEYPDPL